jgi:glycosyltransferase involved in cell wall biosynthesis
MTGVSVIICCFNSSKRLPKTLDHLKVQEFQSNIKWEVIVVDNASTDNTAAIAKEYWGNHPVPLRVVTETKPGLSNARTTGINNSKYDYVTLVDDDNWVENRWVEKLFTILDNNDDVALCGGRGIGVFETERPSWFDSFEESYAIGPQNNVTGILPPDKAFLYGAGIGIKKEILQNLLKSGFTFWLSDRSGKNLSSGGDYELCLVMSLLGYKLYYDHDMTFYHYMPAGRLTWEYMISLTKGFGRSSAVIQQYQVDVFNKKGLERLKFRNYYLSVLMSAYRVFRATLKIVPIMFSDKTGSLHYSKFVYNLHSLLSKLSFYQKHKKLVSDLENGKWRIVSANRSTKKEKQIA